MPYQIPADILTILAPLADAVFPLDSWAAQKKPPRIDQLVPPQHSLPWRPTAGAQTLSVGTIEAVRFFTDSFDHDAENETLAPRWAVLKGSPLAYFQPPSGTPAEWRARRGLNPTARFGVIEAESSNIRYLMTALDGSRTAASRTTFYDACWSPLRAAHQSARPNDPASWTGFATKLLKDQFPAEWATTNPVKSSDFLKQFTVDILLACLGQHNSALQTRDPLWQRAVLIEAGENRHAGNEYTPTQLATAVTTLLGAIAAASGANTRNWSAVEVWDSRPGRNTRSLVVDGEIEISNSNETPVLLKVSPPPGSNPGVRILRLEIRTNGSGAAPKTWKSVRYDEKVTPSQYSRVDIRWEGTSIAEFPVELPVEPPR